MGLLNLRCSIVDSAREPCMLLLPDHNLIAGIWLLAEIIQHEGGMDILMHIKMASGYENLLNNNFNLIWRT